MSCESWPKSITFNGCEAVKRSARIHVVGQWVKSTFSISQMLSLNDVVNYSFKNVKIASDFFLLFFRTTTLCVKVLQFAIVQKIENVFWSSQNTILVSFLSKENSFEVTLCAFFAVKYFALYTLRNFCMKNDGFTLYTNRDYAFRHSLSKTNCISMKYEECLLDIMFAHAKKLVLRM